MSEQPASKIDLLKLTRERLRKRSLYNTREYWTDKVRSQEGLARSNWPSNVYNAFADERQREVIDQMLGDVRGKRIADIGCGTGRMSRYLAERGARVTGFDFAPEVLDTANQEAQAAAAELNLELSWQEFDVINGHVPDEHRKAYDAALIIGVLTSACRDVEQFRAATNNIKQLTRVGGTALFLEPAHGTRLLRRVLKLSASEWIRECEQQGFRLLSRRGIKFAPTRLVFAFRDWPVAFTATCFRSGEFLLDRSRWLEFLSDYKCMLFERSA